MHILIMVMFLDKIMHITCTAVLLSELCRGGLHEFAALTCSDRQQIQKHRLQQSDPNRDRYLGDFAIHLFAVLIINVCNDPSDGGPHFLDGAHVSAVRGDDGSSKGRRLGFTLSIQKKKMKE